MEEIVIPKRGRPIKETNEIEKIRLRIHKYETEEERIEGQKKARDKYNDKKLYLNKFICDCGEEITVGNKSRHMKTIRHLGLLQYNNMQLKNSI